MMPLAKRMWKIVGSQGWKRMDVTRHGRMTPYDDLSAIYVHSSQRRTVLFKRVYFKVIGSNLGDE